MYVPPGGREIDYHLEWDKRCLSRSGVQEIALCPEDNNTGGFFFQFMVASDSAMTFQLLDMALYPEDNNAGDLFFSLRGCLRCVPIGQMSVSSCHWN